MIHAIVTCEPILLSDIVKQHLYILQDFAQKFSNTYIFACILENLNPYIDTNEQIQYLFTVHNGELF